MSTVNSGPQIVKSNLVLHLDAGYMRSYSPNVHPNPTNIFAWSGTSNNNCTLSADATMTRQYGSIPLKMVMTGTDPYTGTYNAFANNLAPAANGQTWTLSVYAKASETVTGNCFIFGANSSGNYIEAPSTSFTVTTSWQRFTFTATFSNASTAYIQIRFGGSSGQVGKTIWWDGVQVERASSATQFNPYYLGDTIWKDVSGNSNNGTLTNGATFNASNRGTISFDGSNDYVSIANNSTLRPTSELTIEYVIQGTTPSGWCPIIGYGNGDYTNGNYLCWVETGGALNSLCRINNGGTVTEYRQYSGIGISSATPKYMSFTMRIGESIKSYYNGVDNLSPTALPLGGSFYYGGTTSPYQIVGLGGAWLNGNIPLFRLYNRALTATEISQNFEATRKRFGL